jgi:hypothetical protein
MGRQQPGSQEYEEVVAGDCQTRLQYPLCKLYLALLQSRYPHKLLLCSHCVPTDFWGCGPQGLWGVN